MADITDILDGIESQDASLRRRAERGLAALGPEMAPQLIRVLRAPYTAVRTPYDADVSAWSVLVVLLVVAALVSVMLALSGGAMWPLAMPVAGGSIGTLGAVAIPGASRASARAEAYRDKLGAVRAARVATARRLLARIDDLRAIAPTVNLCGVGLDEVTGATADRGIPPAADALLGRLLPQVNPANLAAAGVPREQLYALLTSFNALSHPDCLIAILQLAARLDDRDAYPHVMRLVESPTAHTNSFRVREEARRILPDLAAAAARQRVGSRLLRPSAGPEQELLLRPAHGAADPAQSAARLLRPADKGEQP